MVFVYFVSGRNHPYRQDLHTPTKLLSEAFQSPGHSEMPAALRNRIQCRHQPRHQRQCHPQMDAPLSRTSRDTFATSPCAHATPKRPAAGGAYDQHALTAGHLASLHVVVTCLLWHNRRYDFLAQPRPDDPRTASCLGGTGVAVAVPDRGQAKTIMSLIQPARLDGHDPYAYLRDVLTPLSTQRASEIAELLPHRWCPA